MAEQESARQREETEGEREEDENEEKEDTSTSDRPCSRIRSRKSVLVELTCLYWGNVSI